MTLILLFFSFYPFLGLKWFLIWKLTKIFTTPKIASEAEICDQEISLVDRKFWDKKTFFYVGSLTCVNHGVRDVCSFG